MGTKMGPSYTNLFLGYIENQFFNNTADFNLSYIVATWTTALAQLQPPGKILSIRSTQYYNILGKFQKRP